MLNKAQQVPSPEAVPLRAGKLQSEDWAPAGTMSTSTRGLEAGQPPELGLLFKNTHW